ncbi:MAG TPA: hypothetical protein VGR98_00305 [Streptosporangiaceae bacterium]|nr:hypothetical protein [Streptosporangiaceae bacterium]
MLDSRQIVEDPRDQRLERRVAEVESAEHGVQRRAAGEAPRVPGEVDDPGVPQPVITTSPYGPTVETPPRA